MAQWIFKTLPEKMTEEELLDELTDILFSSNIDLNALDHVMAVLGESFPLPFDLPSAEELLTDFYKKHGQTRTSFSKS